MSTTEESQNQDSSSSPARRTSYVDSTDDNLYVVTENGEQCFMWRANQLTYIAQDRKEIPSVLASKFGHLATKLDLSFNSLTSFKYINAFLNLNELILDNNCLSDDQLDFRQNLRLKTLSLNKNKLADLYRVISSIKTCFPNLEYLSLIGNPLCPGSYVSTCDNQDAEYGGTESPILETSNIEELIICEQRIAPTDESAQTTRSTDHQKYRHFIIYHLPNLRFLDSKPIKERERDEALRRCFWMNSQRQEEAQTTRISADQPGEFSEHDDQWRRVALNGRVEREQAATRASESLAGPQEFQLEIISSMPAANVDLGDRRVGQPKGVFSRLVYKYTGKNSEGNRFIRNQDL